MGSGVYFFTSANVCDSSTVSEVVIQFFKRGLIACLDRLGRR
jgi:putative methionine-R-sulfoxide reductase with GAF domain